MPGMKKSWIFITSMSRILSGIRGVAGKLLVHAFEYAKTEGFQVVSSCPFIAGDFLKRFPQYQEIVRPEKFLFLHEKQS